MTRILVVDDKEMMRDSVATTLGRRGYTVVTASSGPAALEQLSRRPVQAIVTDLQMPGMTGIELVEEVRKLDDQVPVVLMTAYGTIETAVEAMKRGAWDYITKPFSGDELLVAVDRALEHGRLRRENQVLRAQGAGDGGGVGRSHRMVGEGERMRTLRERLARIADSHGTVLVSGESGSGKEVAARWVHEHSPRKDQPFLAINCAALSTSLLESELFGHEKGAFTGADRLRKGRFELADGGTLLLDEISEVAPAIQAKLLRVLQEQSFERVGSSRPLSVDVRVIATTNRDLPAEVAAGRFREDLYYRLNVLPLELPPLRDRREDLADLAAHFLAQVAQREGRPVCRLEPEALEAMRAYSWPGNVRELQNVCERAAVLAPGDVITRTLIESWLREPGAGGGQPVAMIEAKPHAGATAPLGTGAYEAAGATPNGTGGDDPADGIEIVCNGDLTLERIEREIIVNTLLHNGGHRRRSAEALGIGVRTLGLKLKKWKEEELVSPTL